MTFVRAARLRRRHQRSKYATSLPVENRMPCTLGRFEFYFFIIPPFPVRRVILHAVLVRSFSFSSAPGDRTSWDPLHAKPPSTNRYRQDLVFFPGAAFLDPFRGQILHCGG